MKHGLGNVFLPFGVNERHQRMSGTVGIPQREGGIIGEVTLVHLSVGSTVAAVNIAEHRRGYHGVIHGCIENTLLGRSAPADVHLLQLLFPFTVGISHERRKVPVVHLSPQVGFGALHADCRQAHTQQKRRTVVVEREHAERVTFLLHLLHRTGELGGKKHFLVFRPARGIAETRYQGRTLDLHSALAHLVPAYALVQIEHHEAILGVGR